MKELRKSFWDFVIVMGSAFLSIPLMIFSESIQARYLGPEKYGQVALVISAISLLFLFGLSWLRLAIMRFGKEEFIKENHLRRTTANFVMLSVFSFLIIISLFRFFREDIFAFLEISGDHYFWLIVAGVLLTVAKNFVFEVLKVIRMIKAQSFLMRFATKIFIALGLCLFIFKILDIRILYVVIIFLVSDLLIVLIGLFLIKTNYILPLRFDKKLLRKMVIFSFPLLFASWSTYVITWIDTYVIKYFLTLEDVGIYQASYKILNTLRSFMITAITTVSTPIIMVFKTKGQITKISDVYLQRLLPQFSFFAMLLVGAILVFSDLGFDLVYGAKFTASVLPFKIIITTLHLSIITASFTAIRVSFDMTKLYLYLGIFAASLNIILDVIFVPVFGIVGAAGATFLVFSINPVIWFVIIHKKFRIKRKLALFFPFFSFAMLLVNVLIAGLVLRLLFTLLIIIMAFLISRKFNLFHKRDIEILDQIRLPEFVKTFYRKLIGIANW